ncbi:MAG TPA: histidine kinase [Terriglobales bacterium]|nr:histidine kinase [Terriglobales bacterium]
MADGRLSRRQALALGFAIFSLSGLLSFFYHYLDDRAWGRLGTAPSRALEEFTGAYTAGLLFILVLTLVRRYPLRRGAWRKPLAIYLAALPLFSVAHTTLMLISRDTLAPLLGLGRYNYGDLWYRFPMEFANQITIYSMMIGTVWLTDLYRDNRRRELAAARLQEELARAQLANLRLQLQPHFLFNTLNTISAVMYEDVERADAMLARLSELLRHSLAEASPADEVPLARELETSRLYLDIMQARFEGRLQVRYAITPEAEAALVPHFLLQPLLENAIRHGGGQEGGAIAVVARREGEALVLEVVDGGRAGTGGGESGGGLGIGLGNTSQRLQRLYGDSHRFQAGARGEGGFAVKMSLPFRTAEATP